MKKAMIALGLGVVMFLGVAYVYAQDPGAGPRRGWMHGNKFKQYCHCRGVRGHRFGGRWKGLNLTPEQRAKFKELRRKFKEENAQLIKGLVTKTQELRLLWTDPKADSKAILAKEGELRDLRNRMRDKIVQYRLEARNLLTPEQIEKLGMMGGIGFGHGFHHHHHHHHHHGWGFHHHRHHYEHGMGRSGMRE